MWHKKRTEEEKEHRLSWAPDHYERWVDGVSWKKKQLAEYIREVASSTLKNRLWLTGSVEAICRRKSVQDLLDAEPCIARERENAESILSKSEYDALYNEWREREQTQGARSSWE